MVFKNNSGIGNIEYIVIGIGILAFIALIVFFVWRGMSIVNDDFQEGDFFNEKEKAYIQDQTTSYPAMWDGLYILLLAGMTAFMWYRSYLANEEILFLILGVLALGVLFYAGAVMSNNFEILFGMDTFLEFQIYFPKMTWVLTHLVTVIFAQGIGAVIIGIVGSRSSGENYP